MRAALVLAVVIGSTALGGCSRQESAWRQAEVQHSVAAYEAYLRDYPAGAHAPEARTRLADLREQQEWDRALRFNTPEAFQRYLSRYPSGRYAQAARDRLSDFLMARGPETTAPESPRGGEPPAPPPAATSVQPAAPGATPGRLLAEAAGAADFRIQLGAFAAGEGTARRAWQTLSSRHPDLLEGLTPRVDVIRKDGRNLWRLQAGPLTEARAKELCAALRARGAACLVAGA
jgi:hypothetical protein